MWRVLRESPGEVFRRATSPEDDVNGGGQWRKRRGEGELGLGENGEAKGQKIGVFYRRVDDFSENVEGWRPSGFRKSCLM